jgi:hypothetical protein
MGVDAACACFEPALIYIFNGVRNGVSYFIVIEICDDHGYLVLCRVIAHKADLVSQAVST